MSVIFDQLRISDDAERLYVNVHVNKAEYFDNIYLDSITIMTADKVSETNPDAPTEDYIYRLDLTGSNYKEANLVLTASDFLKTWEEDASSMRFPQSDMSKTLFFVYVKVKGVPDECTPCRLDEEVTLGVTFDVNMLHQKVMQFTKSLADDCQIPVGFTDFILLWNAFKASVETEHYIPAVKYWNMLFDKSNGISSSVTKPCGCHG